MAVTIAKRATGSRVGFDNAKVRIVDVTGPASYTTNGEALSTADLAALSEPAIGGVGAIAYFNGQSPTGHQCILDIANSKMKFYNGTTEIANTTNLSTVVCRCLVVYSVVNG